MLFQFAQTLRAELFYQVVSKARRVRKANARRLGLL